MSKEFIVYASRNRITGTLCQTLDTKHPDCPPQVRKAAGDNRYLARCVEHNFVVGFTEHYPAGRAIAHVDEWCLGCQAMLVNRDGAVVQPPVLRADVNKVTKDTSDAIAKAYKAEMQAKDEKLQKRRADAEARKAAKAQTAEPATEPQREREEATA